jgi:hypothetical protein
MATAKKTSKSTALVPWEQEMKAAAQRQSSVEKPVGLTKSISTRGGILSIDESAVPGNSLDVVVLVSVHENQMFDGPYNPNVPQVPTCYAFGDPESDEPEENMAPHEKAKSPQESKCAGCWANEMGSADTGKGKACKNVRRLAVVTSDALDSAAELETAEVRTLKVPVMSVKNWANYVRTKLGDELERPTWGVVTTISVVPDAKSQFKINFAFKELVNFDQGLYDAMKSKIREVTPNMVAPYPELEEEAPPARGGRGGRGAAQPMRPTGRAAQAMERNSKAAPAAKKSARSKF